MTGLVETYQDRKAELLQALIEHIQLSVLSLVIACLIAIPLGIYLSRHKKFSEWSIGVTSVIQTIPSLALLGLMIPLVGIGTVPSVIALVLYALLPIVRNTYTGLAEVDPSLKEAARACGMTPTQSLLKVELPLALPVMMAGIRTAMVLIIGTATIAALIGAGGLGSIILLGIDRNDNYLLLLGAIPAALLALLFDGLLRQTEVATKKRQTGRLVVALALIATLIITPFALGRTEQPDLVVAGKLGVEPEILMNMYKLVIEDQTDLNVQVKPNFGKTTFVYKALQSGDIDLYPEFTGTVLASLTNEKPVSNEKEAVFKQARDGLAKQKLALLPPMNYNNTYAVAVPKKVADQYNLKTISDLQQVADQLKAGFTLEFKDRQDGYKGIQETYGVNFKEVVTMEPKLRYKAVESGDIQVIDAYSTDPEIVKYNMVVLEDDQQLFPPYEGAPLLRQETLEEYPEVEEALKQLDGKISDSEMSKMNEAVAYGGKTANQVARDYLQKEGILK
ncbi:ABC transporter permease/substrate-binding protein [Exiguobacterium sp. S22-S28]|uniref:ABC transporter permease/substrate-binding protein n=1 Tax=Exiguobacterium sp. S22-S28 TaxID=3342768 RepID=UPI00372D5340